MRSPGIPSAVRGVFLKILERKVTAHLFAALVVALFCASSALAAEPVAGHIAFVQGKVSIMREFHRKGFVAARVGDALSAGDVIKTGSKAKAQISLDDASTIYVAANSQMQLKQFILNRNAGDRKVAVSVIEGRLRFVVSKVVKVSANNEGKWKSSSFTVETPTAVAGIQGTDFVVTVSRGHTTVAVFEGYVKIGNASYFVSGTITLGANQASTVKKDEKPTEARTLTDAQKDLLKADTTPQVQAQGDAPVAIPAAVIAEENAKIQAALQAVVDELTRADAEGLPIDRLINNALAAGLNVNETITAAVKIGADPGAAVAAAIKAGYPADSVVAAALAAGAPLNTVVQAAVAAGATRSDVANGAQSSGRPADEVASALSAQVFTFTPAAGTTKSTAFTYSAPGGAPPSDKTASQTAP